MRRKHWQHKWFTWFYWLSAVVIVATHFVLKFDTQIRDFLFLTGVKVCTPWIPLLLFAGFVTDMYWRHLIREDEPTRKETSIVVHRPSKYDFYYHPQSEGVRPRLIEVLDDDEVVGTVEMVREAFIGARQENPAAVSFVLSSPSLEKPWRLMITGHGVMSNPGKWAWSVDKDPTNPTDLNKWEWLPMSKGARKTFTTDKFDLAIKVLEYRRGRMSSGVQAYDKVTLEIEATTSV